jgi:cell division protein FtsW
VREFKNGVLPFIVILGLVSLLILLEPNLSMATLVALLGGLVLFTSGAKIGHFGLVAGVGMILVFHQIRDVQYRLARMLTFLNPGDATTEAGFQIHQSLVGIGSGQLFGVGFGEGQQKLGYLPYAYSDFLFSTIGEEWGFVGVCVVVALFALFCWLGFRIARTVTDPFGQYLAVGLTATIGLTAFMHMAVSLGLIPTTGLTLPFMSYGRSSQVISLLGTGILINIGRLRGSARASGGRERGAGRNEKAGEPRRAPARRTRREAPGSAPTDGRRQTGR